MIRIVIHVARYIPRCGNYLVLVLLILTAAEDVFGQPATEKRETEKPVGVQGKIGCRANPTRVKRLLITNPASTKTTLSTASGRVATGSR